MEGLSSLCWVDLVDYQCLETTRFIANYLFKILAHSASESHTLTDIIFSLPGPTMM